MIVHWHWFLRGRLPVKERLLGKKGTKTGTDNLFNQLKLLSLWLLMDMMT